MDSFNLGSSSGEEAQKVLGMYAEELNYLVLGQGLEGQLSPRQKCWKKPFSLLRTTPVPACKHRCSSYLSCHHLNTGHPTLLILRPCPTQTGGPLKRHAVAVLYKYQVLAHAMDLPKISQRFTNKLSACPVPLAEQPQEKTVPLGPTGLHKATLLRLGHTGTLPNT